MQTTTINKNPEKSCCTVRRYTITKADLPLACPLLSERVWDGHPRVYLPILETGKAVCPYCSAEYILENKIKE